MNRSPIAAEAVRDAIATLRSAVGNAAHGLPEEVFLLVSSLTPMINVDLLIRDRRSNQVLYETHAVHDRQNTVDLGLLPYLFEAALKDFPNPAVSPRTVTVTRPVDNR